MLTEIPQLVLAAHHEAGHAVAAVARSQGRPGVIRAVRIEDTGHGHVLHGRVPGEDWAIAIAGPWAEARYRWEVAPPSFAENPDAALEDFVLADVLVQSPDYGLYEADLDRWGTALARQGFSSDQVAHTLRELELGWMDGLAELWPAIRHVAGLLLVGEPVTDEAVRVAVGGAYSVSAPIVPEAA